MIFLHKIGYYFIKTLYLQDVILQTFLIYQSKNNFSIKSCLPLGKNTPAVVTFGLNANLSIFTPKAGLNPHILICISQVKDK